MEDWPSVREGWLPNPAGRGAGGGGVIVTILYLFVLLRLLPAPRGERQLFADSLCGFAGLGSSGVIEAPGENEDLR